MSEKKPEPDIIYSGKEYFRINETPESCDDCPGLKEKITDYCVDCDNFGDKLEKEKRQHEK